ncbi:hypothetical protein C900_01660 [Fulvivirga imtechensis AK7]|uniref:Uncharacterized protein n=1 Tax=Fulvivirga imtechensis AK7 TaxID=1237149 RepID=L8JW05_9BACT|nr:hypothetical protein [Fulvivirga imtechensis]ELR72378.1 hypothetical protein C900_01660 [Fulvivirga imtechensis AK7]
MSDKEKIIDGLASLYLLKEQVNKQIDYAALTIEGESWEDLPYVKDNLIQCKIKLELMQKRIDEVLSNCG